MAKDPAFLFYPGDYISGTMHYSFEEKGAYIDLLMLQFNRGHMTTHMIGRVLGQKKDKLWPVLQEKFIKDENGCYYNERLEHEKERRRRYVSSRYNNKEGKNQHTKSKGHTTGHMTPHMENENENENKYINGVKFLKIEDAVDQLKADEVWLDAQDDPPRKYIEKALDAFVRHCNKERKPARTIDETTKHFNNWVRIKWRDLSITTKKKYI